MTIWQILVEKDYIWWIPLALAIWILGILGGYIIHLLLVFGFILSYTLFDLIGYEGLRQEDKEHSVVTGINRQVNSYRILQFTWYGTLLLIIYFVAGWQYALAGVILHFTALCDILYHYLGKYDQGFYTHWTPLGRVWYLFTKSKTSPLWYNALNAAIGATIAIFILTQ